jgi:hypothetical protein
MQSVGWLNKYAEHNYHCRKLNNKIACSEYFIKKQMKILKQNEQQIFACNCCSSNYCDAGTAVLLMESGNKRNIK